MLAHNNSLPEDALRRSLVHSGNAERLQKLFKKVIAGANGHRAPSLLYLASWLRSCYLQN